MNTVHTPGPHEIEGWEFDPENMGSSSDNYWGLIANYGWHSASPVTIKVGRVEDRNDLMAERVALLLNLAVGIPNEELARWFFAIAKATQQDAAGGTA